MPSDYGYINARIRAMRSFLLKEEDYLQGLGQNTPEEFIAFLSNQPNYANDVRRVCLTQASRFTYDEALKLNLCRIFRKLIKFCEGEPRELILILLRPWDIYNLKTIIRGILSHQKREEVIPALIPAGIWDLEFLQPLTEAKDLKTLAYPLVDSEDALEKECSRLIRNYSPDTPLEILENSLQETYFRKAQEYLCKGNNNAHLVWDYLSLQIDFLNILSILKKIGKVSASINFIKGGSLPEVFLKDLSSLKSVEDVLKTCEKSSCAWLSQEGLNLYKRTQRLSSLERLFKKRQLSFCSKLYTTGDPLSMSIPLGFINFKENEIGNLRFIGKAIHFGMPEDKILEEIIFA